MNALTTPQNGQIAHLTAFDIMMNPEIMDRFERIASVMASSKFRSAETSSGQYWRLFSHHYAISTVADGPFCRSSKNSSN